MINYNSLFKALKLALVPTLIVVLIWWFVSLDLSIIIQTLTGKEEESGLIRFSLLTAEISFIIYMYFFFEKKRLQKEEEEINIEKLKEFGIEEKQYLTKIVDYLQSIYQIQESFDNHNSRFEITIIDSEKVLIKKL